ncbi:MarR family transcriptional regulator [Staphylococcus pasteuri]|uniref:MarR family winged helix-turn-helix transcriptional regulator n=1 Tax=Staphylococcus pasteuri TaxID=45972 RepID=UPI0030BAE7DF
MINNKFFNSFISIYRPYIKLTQPILERHNIHTGQWLVLKDIAQFQPTTLVNISYRRAIEKPTARKFIKVLLERELISYTTGNDKRQKWLSLTEESRQFFETINKEVNEIQDEIIEKSGINEQQLTEITNSMSIIYETILKESQE